MMTSKYLVILLGCVVVLVWESVVVAEECPEGDSNGNCSLTTQYNNELEPTTQEMVTHTAKPMETTKVMETTETTEISRTDETTTQELVTQTPESITNPPPLNALAEDLTDNDIAPTAIPSVIPLISTESSSTNATIVDASTSREKIETTSTASARTEEPEKATETSSASNVTDQHKESAMTDLSTTVSSVVDETKAKTESSSTMTPTTEETTEAKESSTTVASVSVTEGSNEDMETTTSEEHDERTETTMAATTLSAVITEAKHIPETITVLGSADEPKGRALNFTVNEEDPSNIIMSNFSSKSHHHDDFDLSDVTINDDNDDDFEFEMEKSKILAPKYQDHNSTYGICEKGGLTYENGEKLEIGCDSVCTCRNGKMDCTERCAQPFFRKGFKKSEDPLCSAKDVDDDPCCSVLVCTGDTETEPLEMCLYENRTYNRGDHFNKGCSEVCTCVAAGKMTCKPRCLPVTKTSDRCVELPDPIDSCCMKVLCDVTLEEHDSEKEYEKPKQKILSARYINTTAILLTFDSKFDDNESLPDVEVSNDRGNWTYYRLLPGGLVFVKENIKYIKLENTEDIIEVQDPELGPFPSIEVNDDIFKDCEYKGKTFKIGEEYNDNCESLCICLNGQMKCLKIQCPTYFGVDVLDANCIEWETVPKHFVPSAPNCCPEKVRCKDNGSCDYQGRMYRNWDELPSNVTGCDKKCYCEMGKVECQNTCPPVTALPPPTLGCPPHLAMVSHAPGDDCCKEWICKTETTSPDSHRDMFPANFPGFSNQPPQDEIIIQSLDAVDPHTVRLSFTVPQIIVGLHGRVEVRYTSDKVNEDVDSWLLTVFAPPNDLIATSSLAFDLTDLKADTEYKIKVTVTLGDLQNAPTSKVHTITTPKEVHPPVIPINPDLAITDINATWVTVVWRPFTQYELSFIDGLQLRYREIDGMIYTATPLIHRAETRYTLEKLKSNTKYEIGIYFIPFPGQMTELRSENILHFTTANEIDTYGFNVTLDISQIKSQSVEITWNGVPYPEDKYVNIYRVIYQSDSGKEDQSTFKIAKRDSPTKTLIKDLKPGTRYRIWLEVYLTNGKIKTSNVEDFITKPRVAPAIGASTQQDKLSRAEVLESKGDYYGPLVIVAILAAIAILSTLILLLILVRRHNQNKAAITPPSTRISQSAYDNPTYKVEIQQETMGL